MTPEKLAAAGLRVRKLDWKSGDPKHAEYPCTFYAYVEKPGGVYYLPSHRPSRELAQADFEAWTLAALEEG